MTEKFDNSNEAPDTPPPSSEPHSPEMISRVQGNASTQDTTPDQPLDNSTDPPPGSKDLDTPHVIEKHEGSKNLEGGPQESGIMSNPLPLEEEEDQEAKPGSLGWQPGGGIEKGG